MPQLLSINNYYYRRGGSETIFFEHNRLFEQVGWRVVPFAMRGERNEPTGWAPYFAEEVDFRRPASPLKKLASASKVIYSFEAGRRIRKLVRDSRPDIAHAHNIYHHLSPSVLVELRRQRIPVVLTLHDLKLACPSYKMYTKGAVCERCRGGALRNVVVHRCINGSAAMSTLAWLESTVHRALQLYADNVARFVVASAFLRAKFTEWGIDTSRFVHIPNFVDVDPAAGEEPVGDAFVYVGRLLADKGVATLIRAAARARVKLRIVGTGPDAQGFHELAARSGGAVEFAGYLSGGALRAAFLSARAVVVPSELYDNAPVSLMEANALARPVIGARIGGIPELIRDGETGFLFDSGNVEALAAVLERVQALPDTTLAGMGRAAREWMRVDFAPLAYRDRMLDLYKKVGEDR